MKTLLGLFLIALTIPTYADVIKVSEMIPDGTLERSFVYKTNLREKVVLDCQSFIQGLRIGEYESANVFMLGPEECEELQNRVFESLQTNHNHCIDVTDDINDDYICDK